MVRARAGVRVGVEVTERVPVRSKVSYGREGRRKKVLQIVSSKECARTSSMRCSVDNQQHNGIDSMVDDSFVLFVSDKIMVVHDYSGSMAITAV